MGSTNYIAEKKTEKAEFAYNMYKYLMYLKERFNPDELVFAVDSPNWRVDYFKEYYIVKSVIYKDKVNNKYIIEWDFKIHKFEYNEVQDIWLKNKLKNDEIFDLTMGDHYLVGKTKKWVRLETATKVIEGKEIKLKKSQYLDHVLDSFYEGIEGFEKVTDLKEKEEILYNTLAKHTPRYKNRPTEKNWVYETPYKEFKEISMNLAFRCANSFGAVTIKADKAEADDIIAAYVEGRAKTGKDCIIVSVDTDLQQLVLRNQFMRYYNPNFFGDERSHYGGFVKLDQNKAKFELYLKILSGDASDTIPATYLKGKRKLMSEAEAEKILLEHSKPLEFIQKAVERDILIRNTNLVHLSKRPKEVYANIINAIKNYKKPEETYGMEVFGVSDVDMMTTRDIARQHRQYDLENGLVG